MIKWKLLFPPSKEKRIYIILSNSWLIYIYIIFLLIEGDSGGPLMILNKTDNRWYLFGVTSHGANTQTIKPGVYSSIASKLDFIKKYF